MVNTLWEIIEINYDNKTISHIFEVPMIKWIKSKCVA